MSLHPDPLVLEGAVLPAEVEAHLERCPRCRIDRRVLRESLADEPLALPALPLPDATSMVASWRSARSGTLYEGPGPGEDPALPSADALGPYTIDARLGRGGMAVVYRVVDRRTGEWRALKRLRRADGELRQRLAREGRVQGALDTPNVVRVVDVLELGGDPALVLEYVAGPTLQQVLRGERLPLELVDRIASEVLAGVAAAHEAGVVHRDLKPGNVLLDPVDDGFTARVTDFGLARSSQSSDSLHTRTGAVAGTPLYMAPEQLRDASRADARSDVFSLGAVLYELITGLRAFAGLDYVDIVQRVASVQWTPIEQLRHPVPERMVRAVTAALQADPASRPADAGALLALWSPEVPPVAWPTDRVLAGLAAHEPEPVELARSAPNNLEPAADTYVGRAAVRARVVDALERERLVTLTGPGGVGKTRLSQEVGRQMVHQWPGGVWFCDLTAARTPDGIAAALAGVLGLGLGDDPAREMGAALASRGRLLVVLDNFEQVVEHAEALLEPWLEASEAHFLVTSREQLDLFDELVVPLDILDPAEAAELFVSRARRVLPEFERTEGNAAAIDQIVARLDGLPLAIEIVAARVRSVDLERILAHLHRFSGDRHATLRSTLDGSWDLLHPDERAALLRMTAFASPADAEAVSAVLGPLANAVDGLVRRSLVRRAGGRIRLLVPIRQWARARISKGDWREAEEAHGAWFATVDGDTADPVLDDLLVATERALGRGDFDVANEAGSRAVMILSRRGPFRRALELCDAVLEAPGFPERLRCVWLHKLGRLRTSLGDVGQARVELLEARGIAQRLGLVGVETDALNWLGITHSQRNEHDDATRYLLEGLALAEAAGFEQRTAFLNGALAVCAKGQGDLVLSRQRYERSLAIHRRLDNQRGVALVLGDLGTVDVLEGHHDAAEVKILEAIEILARLNNPVEEAVGWHELSDVYLATDRVDEARDAMLKGSELLRAAGALNRDAVIKFHLSDLERKLDRLDAAGTWLEQGLGAAREVGDSVLEAEALKRLAEVREAQGSTQLAARLKAQSEALLSQR